MIDDGEEEEEEDVDVVGEDELIDADDDHSGNEADHNTLAHDLQLSPENSSEDDEREELPSVASPSRSVGRLSSDSGDQDFENVDDELAATPHPVVTEAMASYGVDDVGIPLAFGVPYVEYDDNAQDFVSYIDVGDGMENVPAYGAADDDDDGGLDNFDPQSFFSSIAQGVVEEQQQQQQQQQQHHHTSSDINNDLQVSESDDSAAGDDAEVEDIDVDDAEAEFVSVDDNDDADFDMTEFLQRPPSSD